MFQKLLVRKLWTGLLLLALLMPLLFSISCETAPEPTPTNPFTFDYKLDESNIAFFTDNDGIETLLAASPFYAGAQPLPSQNTGAYDQSRAKKVDEIKKEAVSLAEAAVKLKPGLAKVRSAYFSYLEAGIKAEAKLKPFARETFVQLETLLFKEVTIEAAYNSIVTDGVDNAYAKTFMDYLKVVKAAELGSLYLQDANNLAAYAALALSSLGNYDNAAIKKANAQLDKDMKALDGLRKDLLAVAASLEKIDYGFKQLLSGDYYFTLAADDFITASLPDLEAKADSLTVREGITKEDIDVIQSFLAVFEKWQYQLKKQAESMDKSRLLKVSAWREAKPGYVYAAEPNNNYANAVGSLSGPAKVDEANNRKSIYFAKGWRGVKAAFQGAKTIIGDGVDVVKVVADATLKSMLGTASDIGQGLTGDASALSNSFDRNMSDVKELKSGESYLKSRKEAPWTTPVKVAGEDWVNQVVGGIAKPTVGLFTGLAQAINKLADPPATPEQIAKVKLDMSGALRVASKVIGAPVTSKITGYPPFDEPLPESALLDNRREREARLAWETLLTGSIQRYPYAIKPLLEIVLSGQEEMPGQLPKFWVTPLMNDLVEDAQNWADEREKNLLPKLVNLIDDGGKRAKELLAKPADQVFGPAPVAKPTPGATAGTTPAPRTGTTPKPTAKPTLAPVLSAARNLTGTWKGTGSWSSLGNDERPVLKMNVDVVLNLVQDGNAVWGWLNYYVTRVEALNPDFKHYARSYSDNRRQTIPVNGEASVTNLYLTGYSGPKFEFTFTTDLMSGQVSGQLIDYYTKGRKVTSEPKAIKLVRQPGTTTGADQPVVTKLYNGTFSYSLKWQDPSYNGLYNLQVSMSGTASFSNLKVIVKDEAFSGNVGATGPLTFDYSVSTNYPYRRPTGEEAFFEGSLKGVAPGFGAWNVYHASGGTGEGYIELQISLYITTEYIKWSEELGRMHSFLLWPDSAVGIISSDLMSERYRPDGGYLWKNPFGLAGGTRNFSGAWIISEEFPHKGEKVEYSGSFTLTPVPQK